MERRDWREGFGLLWMLGLIFAARCKHDFADAFVSRFTTPFGLRLTAEHNRFPVRAPPHESGRRLGSARPST